MENASRALFIAAGVLVGVLILTIIVVLFNSFAGSSKNIIDKIEKNKIAEFNNDFLKYSGVDVGITVHDVITMVNKAKESNSLNNVETQLNYNQKSLYIQMDVKNYSDIYFNFEKKTEEDYNDFIKNNLLVKDENGLLTKTKLFKISSIETSDVTGRVIYIKIENIN